MMQHSMKFGMFIQMRKLLILIFLWKKQRGGCRTMKNYIKGGWKEGKKNLFKK